MNQTQGIWQSHQLRPQLAPSVVHSIQLLSMPYTALVPFLQKIALGNPLLDLNETGAEDRESYLEVKQEQAAPSKSGGGYQVADADSFETEEELLRLELLVMKYPERVERAALVILEELDEHGFWDGSMEELARHCGVPEATALLALGAVQSLKPAGIGARSLAECLALQVEDSLEWAADVRSLMEENLSWADGNHTRQIQKKYGVTARRAEEMVAYIRTLTPYPVRLSRKGQRTVFVRPEMSVHAGEQGLEVRLSSRAAGILSLNEDYLAAFGGQALDERTEQYLRDCRHTAKELMDSLRMRDHTMQMILEEIVRRQSPYFEKGPEYLQPMTRAEIAESLHLSNSTVCRCIQEKYIETDFSVMPLGDLFSSGVQAAGDKVVSAVVVKAAIRKLLEEEKEGKHYSDRELAELLGQQGIQISRRTVSKYRNAEQIENSSRRNQQKGKKN